MANAERCVLVLGYFDRGNLGDDLFEAVWKHVFRKDRFSSHHVIFTTIDDLHLVTEKEIQVIILAGGDVLNYYFLTQLQLYVKKIAFKGVLTAFSVGIPYSPIIVDGLLDSFQYIMCRAQVDAVHLRQRLRNDRIDYFPDLSVYLAQDKTFWSADEWSRLTPTQAGIPATSTSSQLKKVGVFLVRNIFNKNENYGRVVEGIAQALLAILTQYQCQVILIPFNTYKASANEDDRIINQDVFAAVEALGSADGGSIHVISASLSVKEMYHTFQSLDMAITMRYHSHMYAFVSGIPFVSIQLTSKVHNLLQDADLEAYAYPLDVDSNGLPVKFDSSAFLDVFNKAYKDKHMIKQRSRAYVTGHNIATFEDVLGRILTDGISMKSVTSGDGEDRSAVTPTWKSPTTITGVISELVKYIFKDNGQTLHDQDLTLLTNEIHKGNVTFSDLIDVQGTDPSVVRRKADFLAALACYGLVQIPYPKYHFGMSKKILQPSFNARADFTWVWTDNNNNQNRSRSLLARSPPCKPLFDATFVGIEDFKGCHRSGWQYVLDSLMQYHSTSVELILDNYVDRTFHWAHDIYAYTGIIPFPRSWCGFIHHTFDTGFSPYNVPSLFDRQTFVESLVHCRGLFTLSRDLAKKLKALLVSKGFPNIPVRSFVHPTEMARLDFSLSRFLANNDRKVIMIGAWLRDNFAIYRMTPHSLGGCADRVVIRKAILRGRNMSNYFKPTDLAITITGAGIASLATPPPSDEYTYKFNVTEIQPFTDNKFALGLMQSINEAWHSVEEIGTLSNEDYDKLLSENVVFLKLVDASAVNTIIECIVRKTPVLVNRHPAVEEMLGTEYPFYYDGLTEAGAKVNHLPTIAATVNYLEQQDTTRFQMDRFLRDVEAVFDEPPFVIDNEDVPTSYK